MMKKITMITALLLGTISASALSFAEESKSITVNQKPQLNAIQALEAAQNAKPDLYDSVELYPGPNGQWLYIVENSTKNEQSFVLIDGSTGKNITNNYTSSKYSLTEAMKSIENTFSGTVVGGEKEYWFEDGISCYAISLLTQEGQHKTVLIDANTLKVIDMEYELEDEDYDHDEFEFGIYHMEESPYKSLHSDHTQLEKGSDRERHYRG